MAALLSFTLYQALLSALGAILFGTLLAMAVIRLPRDWATKIEAMLIAPFFMPPLFVILAVISLYHETFFGVSVFGLFGILIAHWILNIPLVFYLILRAWRETPAETVYIAQNLNVVFKAVEWPLIRRTAPRAFAIVMLYATLSFTIVLIMGGGPASSTLEIGIYQAIVFSFDIKEAAGYAAVQSIIGLVLFFVARGHEQFTTPNFGDLTRIQGAATALPIIGTLFIGSFTIVPLVAMAIKGIMRFSILFADVSGAQIFDATLHSLLFALTVSIFANTFALILIWRKTEWVGWLVAAISPLVIAVITILALRQFVNPYNFGWTITVCIAALAMSPLLINLWRQGIDSIAFEERQLAQIYFSRFAHRAYGFWWLKLRASVLRNSALAFVLAFGDLALFPIFAPNGYENLAILIWRLMASYHIDAAIALGILTLAIGVLILSFSLRYARYVEG